ncbi:MAG TPA: ion channel [Candidatus Angelobacter sp.]|jgi:inward rectifier potassium channel|nr:ion channel [Candidatus Angelobacter sp.]
MNEPNPLPADINQETRDLGFGSVLSQEQRLRLLNRDGTFNVYRKRKSTWRSMFTYHGLLSMPATALVAVVTVTYLVLNLIFAVAFMLCGPTALQPVTEHRFWQAFFFSVHTFATIGYGNIWPVGMAANVVVTLESIVGLLSFALATGLIYARFARPTAHIIYSENAIIAPYRGTTAFEFRIINGRRNQLINLEAVVILTRFEDKQGIQVRQFHYLALERTNVTFFPLAWTIVHPINESSPLFGWTQEMLLKARAEFLILLAGTDEVFAQIVHSRSSYAADEVLWGFKFMKLFQEGDGVTTIDMRKFHTLERAEIPTAQQAVN